MTQQLAKILGLHSGFHAPDAFSWDAITYWRLKHASCRVDAALGRQRLFYGVLAIRTQCSDDAARRYERQLRGLLQKHLDHGPSTLELESLPIGMPDNPPRVSRKKLTIGGEHLKKEACRLERSAALVARDDRILVTQQAERASQQQDSIGNHITVRQRSPVLFTIVRHLLYLLR